jgi:hypothetical protein
MGRFLIDLLTSVASGLINLLTSVAGGFISSLILYFIMK